MAINGSIIVKYQATYIFQLQFSSLPSAHVRKMDFLRKGCYVQTKEKYYTFSPKEAIYPKSNSFGIYE